MQLQIFNNKDLGQVRVIGNNGNPLFCLRDICEALNIQNVSDVKSAIDREFDKGGRFDICPLETNGGKQNFIFITEPQLYFVLMRSDKPKAKPFRQWVVGEVLPSIRIHGFYTRETMFNYKEYEFLQEKLALQQEIIVAKTQLIALQNKNLKFLEKQQQNKIRQGTRKKIFELLSEGKSQSQVARELQLTRGAVSYHIKKDKEEA